MSFFSKIKSIFSRAKPPATEAPAPLIPPTSTPVSELLQRRLERKAHKRKRS